MKLVWNVASLGVSGFQVPVLCCSSPLLLLLTQKMAFQPHLFGMGDLFFPLSVLFLAGITLDTAGLSILGLTDLP